MIFELSQLCSLSTDTGRGITAGAEAGTVLVTAAREGVALLHTANQDRSHTWLLGASGSQIPANIGRLVAAAAHDERLVLAHAQADGSVSLHIYTLQAGSLGCQEPAHLQPPSSGATVISTCLHALQHTTLWSDGTIHSHKLSGKPHLDSTHQLPTVPSSAGHGMAAELTPRKGSAQREPPDNRTAFLVALSNDLLAALTWADGQTGKRPTRKLRLTVLDLKYGTVPLETDLQGWKSSGGQPPSLQACLVDQRGEQQLAVVIGRSVCTVPLQVPPVTLASLVAASSHADSSMVASTRPAHAPQHDAAQWLSVLEQAAAQPRLAVPISATVIEQASTSRANEEQQLMQDVVSLQGTGPGSKAAPAEVAKVMGRVKHAAKQKTASFEVLSRTALILAQQGHWKALQDFLTAVKLTALGSCPGLVPLLAQEEQHGLLTLLLPHGKDLSLSDLHLLLDHLLGRKLPRAARQQRREFRQELRDRACRDLQEKKAVPSQLAIAAMDMFTPREVCLHAVVAMPVDSAVLLGAMQGLLPQQALMLARYLLKWLTFHKGGPTTELREAQMPPVIVPPLRAVVQWLGTVINAHLVSLALLPKAHQVFMANMAQSVASINLHVPQ
ncbi:hypothetical protein WJX73_001912 [Symbiochloris irregularis]|uniref:Uncharacterized protein n=1 Tax=Symbiochloris irregularis TaxID=706552 RepID=A0AAW1PJ90_9CHLO